MTTALTFLLVLLSAQANPVWKDSEHPVVAAGAEPAPLDPHLPQYTRCMSSLQGGRHGSVTAILPELFARWAEGFATEQPQATLSASPPYGPPQGRLSTSLTAFLNGRESFALISRQLTSEDKTAYRRVHGNLPLVVPVAAGSWRQFGFVDTVVVIVNEHNPIKSLSFAQVEALFSARGARVRPGPPAWGDIGVGEWTGRPIHIFGGASWIDQDSARSAVVHQRILKGDSWRRELRETGSEADAPGRVAADPLGIAITGLGHLPEGTRPVALSVEANGPAIAPTLEAVRLHRYPLSRTVDLLLHRRRDGRIDPLLAEFVRYILSQEGQAIVARQDVFLPLRSEQAARSLAILGPCRAHMRLS